MVDELFPLNECWKFNWVFNVHCPSLCSLQIPCFFLVCVLLFSPPWLWTRLHLLKHFGILQTGHQVQLGSGKCFQTFLPKALSLQAGTHIPHSYSHAHNRQIRNQREKGMRKRGYKRKSIRSQEFREDRLRNLQSHPLRNKKVSIMLYCCLY